MSPHTNLLELIKIHDGPSTSQLHELTGGIMSRVKLYTLLKELERDRLIKRTMGLEGNGTTLCFCWKPIEN